MPRRRVVAKRRIGADPKYGSEIVAKFINAVMVDGKKSVAEKVVYKALEIIGERLHKKAKVDGPESNDEGDSGSSSGEGSVSSKKNTKVNLAAAQARAQELALEVFTKALENIRPTVEVRSRRVGGATFQVPVEVRPSRSYALAMRWVIKSARARSEHGMIAQLVSELQDGSEGRGNAIKMRDDMHRMAEANKAFAHFRWS